MKLDLPERVLRATVFDPEVRTRFIFADPATLARSPVSKRYDPRNVQLLGDDGTVLGSVQHVIKGFVDEMRTTESLSGRFDRGFPLPTYLKPSRRRNECTALTGSQLKSKSCRSRSRLYH